MEVHALYVSSLLKDKYHYAYGALAQELVVLAELLKLLCPTHVSMSLHTRGKGFKWTRMSARKRRMPTTTWGVALADKGLTDEAIREYKEAIRIRPEYADAHFNLGVDLKSKGLIDDAIREYKEAIRIDPEDAKGHYGLGDALAYKGKDKEAIEALRGFIEYAPSQDERQILIARDLIREIEGR